tara:strand:+ start:484 stop:1569 length:1086 start_codon:yes stop_codon:yes gene_type:complete
MYRVNPVVSITALFLMFFSATAFADLAYIDPATNQSVLDQVVNKFGAKAKAWHAIIEGAAIRLFWSLVLISMVWTFGMMILRKADIGDFFAEFTRFIIFTGFFFWLLANAVSGHNIAGSIIESMQVLGNQASGQTGAGHSNIMDVGFQIWRQAYSSLSLLDPVDSFIGFILSLIILIILTVIAVNMLLLLISAWVLMYAGVFFLGFGGARWTTDIAINYFKTVLGIGIQLLVMTLIVGIGSDFLSNYYGKMSQNMMNFEELGVMLIFSVAFFVLISRLPPLLAGIIAGSSISSPAGIGGLSGGGAMAAAATGGFVAYQGVQMIRNQVSPGRNGTDALRKAMEEGQARESQSASNNIARGNG